MYDLPPGTEPPPTPQPVSVADWFPHITSQVRQPDGTVLVTFAMPGPSRMVVRVPLASWLQGEHLRTMNMPASVMRALGINDATGEPSQRGPEEQPQ